MGYHADVHVDDAALRTALAEDVRRGLGAREKWLPPKYFYDAAGSALFERITRLPEYYLTRAEQALLEAHAPAIVGEVRPEEIVELGAGAPTKAQRLLAAPPAARCSPRASARSTRLSPTSSATSIACRPRPDAGSSRSSAPRSAISTRPRGTHCYATCVACSARTIAFCSASISSSHRACCTPPTTTPRA